MIPGPFDYMVVRDCGKKGKTCFNDAVAIEDLFQWPNTTDRICTDNVTQCKNHIRIDFSDPLKGELHDAGIWGLFEQVITTDYSTIAFIAGSSAAVTLILVGIVLGISR